MNSGIVCGVDFETNGDDPKKCDVTEVGALRRVPYGNGIFATGDRLSQFCWFSEYPEQPPEIIDLTGITDAMLIEKGQHPRDVFEKRLFPLIEQSQYCLAHNKDFDETVFYAVCERYGLNPPRRRWLCSLRDIPWPAKYKCKKLSHLALDAGLPMDHRELHRAADDVELMMELVFQHYKLHEIVEYADTPEVDLRILIPAPWEDNNAGKNIANKLGFTWQKPKYVQEDLYPKCWVKRVKLPDMEKLKTQTSYEIVVLKHVERDVK